MIPIRSAIYTIKIYHQGNGNVPLLKWMKSLDAPIRARINARIARFETGYFGDHKLIGEGLIEARFFFGSGYRVYFSMVDREIVLLMNGGDKATQSNDVDIAKFFLKSYLEDLNAHKK